MKPIAVLAFLASLGLAHGQIKQVQLPYRLTAIEPAIDAQTMEFHYGTHYATYVNNTNAALANTTSIRDKNNLTAMIRSVRNLQDPLRTTIRNQGGGAWNHALYFKHLAAPNTAATQTTGISSALNAAINTSFGSFDAMKTELTTAASKVFGSGWAWLCLTGGATPLVVTTTPNQDNPLMGNLPGAPPVKAAGCTPILGIDVWEHSYYLKHGPKRAAYLQDFWNAVNWQQVSRNYQDARAGVELVLDDAEPADNSTTAAGTAVGAGGATATSAAAGKHDISMSATVVTIAAAAAAILA